MKAAVLEAINEPLQIREVGLTPLKTGQVLVKVLISGLCGAQLQEIKGFKGNARFLPHLMGHEGCGIVEEIGSGVTTVNIGDKVVMHWRPGTGIESDFPNYELNNKIISSGKVTTFNEYSIVSENRLTKVPSDTPSELCAILGCALTTALGIIDNEIELKFGESIAIIGCGGVGLNLIHAASMKGASEIIGVDNNMKKKSLATNCGANIFLKDLNAYEEKIDVIIDTTGISEVLTSAVKKLSGTGRLILVGQPQPGRSFEIFNAVNLFSGSGQMIRATQGGRTNPENDIPRYIKLFQLGKLNISNMITNSFELDNINNAFDLLKTGNAGRILININKN